MPTRTPSLIDLPSLEDYITRIRAEYDGETISTPEGLDIKFFLQKDEHCKHALCGKNKDKVHFFRAKRILWIRHLLENPSVRLIKQSIENNNIVFIAPELAYCVICREQGNYLKFVSHFGRLNKNQINNFNDLNNYRDYPN